MNWIAFASVAVVALLCVVIYTQHGVIMGLLKDKKRRKLQPGDIVVVESQEHLSTLQIDALTAWAERIGIKILLLGPGMKVTDATRDCTEIVARADKLQRFKDFVHSRLDQMGVPPEFPNGEHTLEGCRIGDRLDWVSARMAQTIEARENKPGRAVEFVAWGVVRLTAADLLRYVIEGNMTDEFRDLWKTYVMAPHPPIPPPERDVRGIG